MLLFVHGVSFMSFFMFLLTRFKFSPLFAQPCILRAYYHPTSRTKQSKQMWFPTFFVSWSQPCGWASCSCLYKHEAVFRLTPFVLLLVYPCVPWLFFPLTITYLSIMFHRGHRGCSRHCQCSLSALINTYLHQASSSTLRIRSSSSSYVPVNLVCVGNHQTHTPRSNNRAFSTIPPTLTRSEHRGQNMPSMKTITHGGVT